MKMDIFEKISKKNNEKLSQRVGITITNEIWDKIRFDCHDMALALAMGWVPDDEQRIILQEYVDSL